VRASTARTPRRRRAAARRRRAATREFAAHALAAERLGARDAVGVEHERGRAARDEGGDAAQRVGLVEGAPQLGGDDRVDGLRIVPAGLADRALALGVGPAGAVGDHVAVVARQEVADDRAQRVEPGAGEGSAIAGSSLALSSVSRIASSMNTGSTTQTPARASAVSVRQQCTEPRRADQDRRGCGGGIDRRGRHGGEPDSRDLMRHPARAATLRVSPRRRLAGEARLVISRDSAAASACSRVSSRLPSGALRRVVVLARPCARMTMNQRPVRGSSYAPSASANSGCSAAICAAISSRLCGDTPPSVSNCFSALATRQAQR
jgi:hypothetical protein